MRQCVRTEKYQRPVVAPAVPVERLLGLVVDALSDLKAVDIKVLDVTGMTSITDRMVVAGGTSTRHVKSIADHVVLKAKQAGNPPLGVEGEQAGEWVLIDLGDVVVHVMLPPVRAFYALEKLWSVGGTEATDSP
jgi:ribosome-associated protein